MKNDNNTIASTTRRILLKGAAAAGGVLLANVPVRAATSGGDVLRLGVIGPTRAPTGPSGYALAQGYLQRELAPLGFRNVSVHVFQNGPDLNEAFLAGALDVGIYGDTPALVARAKGLNGRLIGFEETGLSCWLVTPHTGVRGEGVGR
jgi:sulfonate transport system substrate-binding protein